MKKLKSILEEHVEIEETINMSQAFTGPVASDGSLEYDDISMTKLDDPRVISIFNRYLATASQSNVASIREMLLRVKNKLGIFGLCFDFGDICNRIEITGSAAAGDRRQEDSEENLLFPLKLFGGWLDPYTGITYTGLEEMCPQGLFLELGIFPGTANNFHMKIVDGSTVNFDEYDSLEVQKGFRERSLGNLRDSLSKAAS